MSYVLAGVGVESNYLVQMEDLVIDSHGVTWWNRRVVAIIEVDSPLADELKNDSPIADEFEVESPMMDEIESVSPLLDEITTESPLADEFVLKKAFL